jgi:hypothetical protein
MARLDMRQRRALSPDDYAIPERAPGPGSYPIPDQGHAEAALSDCEHGEPGDCERVRDAVHKKFGVNV